MTITWIWKQFCFSTDEGNNKDVDIMDTDRNLIYYSNSTRIHDIPQIHRHQPFFGHPLTCETATQIALRQFYCFLHEQRERQSQTQLYLKSIWYEFLQAVCGFSPAKVIGSTATYWYYAMKARLASYPCWPYHTVSAAFCHKFEIPLWYSLLIYSRKPTHPVCSSWTGWWCGLVIYKAHYQVHSHRLTVCRLI